MIPATHPPPSNHAPHSPSLQHTSLLPQLRSFAHAIPFARHTLPHLLLHSVGLCLLHLTENNQASLHGREGKGRKFKGRVASGLVGFRAQALRSVALPPRGLHPDFSLSFHLLPRGGGLQPDSPLGSRAGVKKTTSISVPPQRPRVHPGPILEPIGVGKHGGHRLRPVTYELHCAGGKIPKQTESVISLAASRGGEGSSCGGTCCLVVVREGG